MTVSGGTVTVPAGYYASSASKSVASGTAGTPTATKGAVSNHSISVTPSVTNTTGYITGSTKTGTAVTVSASELVSGSQTIEENNTYDVTNLASVIVNVEGEPGEARIVDTPDTAGGTIRSITTGEETSLTTKTVTPNDETQYAVGDNYLDRLRYTQTIQDRTGNPDASANVDIISNVTFIENQEYRVIGKINVRGTNSIILETYNVDAIFTWNTTRQNIFEGDSDTYYCYFKTQRAGSNFRLIYSYQKTATYGFDFNCCIYERTNYDGLSKVTVNPVPDTYYSSDFIKNMIGRDTSFTTFIFPDGITKIGSYAFAGCNYLALTSLPSSITFINTYAFYNCTNLALTSLPSGLNPIYGYVFYNCRNLALTSLPSSVTSIGNYTFKNCTGITTLSCDGTITSFAQYAFNGDSTHHMQLTSARFPNMALTSSISTVFGSTTAANACQELEICDIGITSGINSSAFANCYKLQTLILRKTSVCTLASTTAFTNTPLSGYNSLTATVYVPQSLISSYQTASNWSTLYAGGNVTFSAIEGSDYELD